MTRTKPLAQIAAKAKADAARQAWLEDYRRAIDDSLALAELRNRVGVTQSKVAQDLNVSQANIRGPNAAKTSTSRPFGATLPPSVAGWWSKPSSPA
jgi:hypothetical protein